MAFGPDRVGWVDYAKGICIVMVVMMHSTLGVEQATGKSSRMGALVTFAKPFRMPDLFLISRLFLAQVIDRHWPAYSDTKVVHFAYFYALWGTIQFTFKAPISPRSWAWPAWRRPTCCPIPSRSERCGSSNCCLSSSWLPS